MVFVGMPAIVLGQKVYFCQFDKEIFSLKVKLHHKEGFLIFGWIYDHES